jgi:fructose-bisphosphate aldolase class I
MNRSELESTARAMVAKGKGILAADESSGTIKKRFDSIKLESTEEARRTYREMLFTAPNVGDYISGVIMYDETLRQKTKDGTPFAQYLQKLGVVPGIKVDTGAKPLAGFPHETITEGLDGLRERLAEYYKLGARFAKWRAVIDIGAGFPTQFGIDANAHALARYAALCQEANIVPIVEPEVLMDGDHSIERCEEVTSNTLASVFAQLHSHRIHLEGISSPTWSSRARRPPRGPTRSRWQRRPSVRSSAMCRARCRASRSSRAGRARPKRRSI